MADRVVVNSAWSREALIEEGGRRHTVYLKTPNGEYVPRDVEAGVQGELYTEIVSGLSEGEQVVTTGSFFIDSEVKLKGEGGGR